MYQAIQAQLRSLGAGGLVLRLGATHAHPQKRQWFAEGTHHVLMNLDPRTEPDTVMDARSLALPSEVFDAVVADQLLEHVPTPEQVLRETYRVLRPGGLVVIATPFMLPIHHPPDYWRFSEEGLEVLLGQTGFCEISTGSWGHREAVAVYLRCSWRGVHSKAMVDRLLNQEPDQRFPLHCWAVARKTR